MYRIILNCIKYQWRKCDVYILSFLFIFIYFPGIIIEKLRFIQLFLWIYWLLGLKIMCLMFYRSEVLNYLLEHNLSIYQKSLISTFNSCFSTTQKSLWILYLYKFKWLLCTIKLVLNAIFKLLIISWCLKLTIKRKNIANF